MGEESRDVQLNSANATSCPRYTKLSARGPLIRNLCIFTIVYFIVIVVFFFTRDVKTGLIRLQDILTMLNPLLLVPLFYVIALIDATEPMPCWYSQIVFLILTVIYVHGDGYHLAANAIHRYEEDLLSQNVKDVVYLYDEELGHYYTYAGFMGLHGFWVMRQTQLPFSEPFQGSLGRVALTTFGVLHGLVLFITFVEGKFAIPAIIFFAVQVAYCLMRRDRISYDPIFVFTLAYGVTGLLLLIIWAVWQRGFPELTKAGVI